MGGQVDRLSSVTRQVANSLDGSHLDIRRPHDVLFDDYTTQHSFGFCDNSAHRDTMSVGMRGVGWPVCRCLVVVAGKRSASYDSSALRNCGLGYCPQCVYDYLHCQRLGLVSPSWFSPGPSKRQLIRSDEIDPDADTTNLQLHRA